MTNTLRQKEGIHINRCRCEEFFHQKIKLFDYTKQDRVLSTNKSINYDLKRPRIPKYFNIGYVLLIVAIGGIDFDAITGLFEHSHIDSNSCCLLHFLMETESRGKFTISNFLSCYSSEMIDFLCQILSFRSNVCISSLKSHPWLRSHSIRTNVKLSLKEIIKITRDNKSADTQGDKRLEQFANSYEIIRSNNKEINYDLRDKIVANRSVVKDICREIGVSVMEFSHKLQNIVI
jgi:hypothetical protein